MEVTHLDENPRIEPRVRALSRLGAVLRPADGVLYFSKSAIERSLDALETALALGFDIFRQHAAVDILVNIYGKAGSRKLSNHARRYIDPRLAGSFFMASQNGRLDHLASVNPNDPEVVHTKIAATTCWENILWGMRISLESHDQGALRFTILVLETVAEAP